MYIYMLCIHVYNRLMFTKIIKELIESGLSETEIASLTSVSQPTINRIRNGNNIPGGQLAVALIDLHKKRDRHIKALQRKVA